MDDHGKSKPSWFVRVYLWATELLYGPLAWTYDAVAWLVSFGYWSRWRWDAYPYLQAGNVLEIGFGTGEMLTALARAGVDVVGMEPSWQMQSVTTHKLNKIGMLIKRVRGKSDAMPFADETFDNLLSTFPSNYIFFERTIGEAYRVMKNHGCWVVTGLGVTFHAGIKKKVTNLWMGGAIEPLVALLQEKMEAIGFEVRQDEHTTEVYSLPVLIMEKHVDE